MKTGEHGEDCDLVASFPWLSEFGCSLKLACGNGLRRNGGTQLEDLKAEIFTTSFDHIYSNSLTSLNVRLYGIRLLSPGGSIQRSLSGAHRPSGGRRGFRFQSLFHLSRCRFEVQLLDIEPMPYKGDGRVRKRAAQSRTGCRSPGDADGAAEGCCCPI